MKSSRAAWLAVVVLCAVGLGIAIPWVAICFANEGGLVANGAWLLIVICFAAALAMIIQAMRLEAEEDRAERYAEEFGDDLR